MTLTGAALINVAKGKTEFSLMIEELDGSDLAHNLGTSICDNLRQWSSSCFWTLVLVSASMLCIGRRQVTDQCLVYTSASQPSALLWRAAVAWSLESQEGSYRLGKSVRSHQERCNEGSVARWLCCWISSYKSWWFGRFAHFSKVILWILVISSCFTFCVADARVLAM